MTQTIFPVPAEWAANAHMDKPGYEAAYKRSIEDPDGFWAEQAERIDWIEQPTIVKNTSFDPVSIKWFEDGVLNVAANCIDRHLDSRADQPAIIWEPDDPEDEGRILTYAQLHEEVSRCANALRQLGVKRGDRVTIYLPMIPEIAIAMLACARIGAVHSVVFAGFSPEALAGRITDCASRIIITADEGRRGGKPIALKANVDAAAELAGIVDTIVTVRHTGGDIAWEDGRDVWWHEAMDNAPADCPPEPMGAEDPLFIL